MFYEDDIRKELRQRCTGRKLREFCRVHKLDASAVSRMIHGKRPINTETAAALGYTKKIVFIKSEDSLRCMCLKR